MILARNDHQIIINDPTGFSCRLPVWLQELLERLDVGEFEH
jgi:hypothetical protein